MTEADARTKRCPILKVITIDRPEEVTINRFPHCIASDCMMWRESYDATDDGFCGLAGGSGAATMGYPPGTVPPSPPAVSPPLPPAPAPSRPAVTPRRH